MSKSLILPVKKVYFDEILSGSKTFEFRLRTEYWRKRLVGRTYSGVVITLGYPRGDDASKRIIFPWSGYEERIITHPHFGDSPVDVFAIILRPRP